LSTDAIVLFRGEHQQIRQQPMDEVVA